MPAAVLIRGLLAGSGTKITDSERSDPPQSPQSFCISRKLYGKIGDRKKIVQITISFEIKFSYLKRVANVSLRTILEPF